MNHHARSFWFVLVVLLILLLAACGPVPTASPTPLPTATATPRSTPLPEVATAVPLGSTDRPLTLMLVPQGTRREAPPAAEELVTLIADLTGLNVEIELADSYGQVVDGLCGATPVVGWLDGISYIVAEAQGCADPSLMIVRRRDAGSTFDLLMDAESVGTEPDPEDVSRLEGETVCRVADDAGLWQVAELILRTGGVNPLTGLDEIIDVEDADAVVSGIYDGDCTAGVVPGGYLDDGIGRDLRALDDLADRVVLVTETPEIPFGVLVYPQTVPLHVRIPVSDIFVQLDSDAEQATVLAALLAQDDLERVEAADFDDFRAFMQATGLDFVALGE